MRLRRLGWTAVGVLALMLTGVAVYWWLATRALDQAVERWVDQRRGEGYRVEWRQRARGGFPLWIEARFEQPSLARPDGPTPWSWEGESLVLSAPVWNPSAVAIAGRGRHILSYLGQVPPVRLTGDGFTGRLGFAAGKLDQGELEIVEPALWIEPEKPEASARRLRLGLDKWIPGPTDEKTESAAGRITLSGLVLAPHLTQRLPFPEPIDMSVTASLFGSLEAGPPARTLAAWRDAGGIVEIGRLDLIWGPLNLTGNGTVSLDDSMRPLGAGTAAIRGWEQTLDRLVAVGAVQSRQASIARAVLSALSKPTPGGAEVTVPLTAQDGRLSVGPVPVMPLGP